MLKAQVHSKHIEASTSNSKQQIAVPITNFYTVSIFRFTRVYIEKKTGIYLGCSFFTLGIP